MSAAESNPLNAERPEQDRFFTWRNLGMVAVAALPISGVLIGHQLFVESEIGKQVHEWING